MRLPHFLTAVKESIVRKPQDNARDKIVEALRSKNISERLGAQATDYIHERQAYWGNDQTDGKSSLIYYVQGDAHEMVKINEARIARDLEAQKAREVEPEFIAAARDIGALVEQIKRIPDHAQNAENLRKLEALGKEVDPHVLTTMREATRALEDAAKPLLQMLEDPKGGIAKLVTSSDAPVYDDQSPLRALIEEMREARKFDEELAGESHDYEITKTLEESPEVYARYRAEHLQKDPSRRLIYYYYLLNLLHQFIEEFERFKNLHQLDVLFDQLSKNHLHAMAEEVALPYGKKLDVLATDRRYIREAEITEAERAKFILEVTAACLRALEINRTLHQFIGSIPLPHRLEPR